MLNEKRDYLEELQTFEKMNELAIETNDPTSLALSCMGLGTEHLRMGNKDKAIEYLEAARDYSFQTSKHVAALVIAHLSRAYAESWDRNRFKRSIDTAYQIACSLGKE